MAAVLVGAILSDLGLFSVASEAAVTLTGSEVAGSLIGGSVVGAVSQKIGITIEDTVQTVGEKIFGDKQFNQFEKSLGTSLKGVVDPFNSVPQGIQFGTRTDRPSDLDTFDNETLSLSEEEKGKLAGKFTVDLASNLAQEAMNGTTIDADEVIQKTILNNSSSYIVDYVVPFLAGKTMSGYSKISEVYNGYRDSQEMQIADTIFEHFDSELGLKYFVLVDEVGDHFTLYQTTGLILPAIHGNFVGVSSPNNNLCVDLVDLFCSFHDWDYISGVSRTGDQKLISRLSSRYSGMNSEEQGWARFCMAYFSTLGNIVSAVAGSTDKTISEYPQAISSTDDLYHEAANDNGMLIGDLQVQKMSFHKAYKESVADHSINSGVMSSISSKGANFLLKQEFGKMMVQLG